MRASIPSLLDHGGKLISLLQPACKTRPSTPIDARKFNIRISSETLLSNTNNITS